MATRTEASSPVARAYVPGDPASGRGVVFAVVSLGLFMASIDGTIVATALHSLQTDLGAGIEWTSWTVTVYSLGQVLVMPLAGKLSDLYGRKRIFLVAVVVFTLASLGCGLSRSIGMLVVLRAVQSIGGGAFMPSATGIVSDAFGRNRDRAIGMFSSIFPIGGIAGPVIGGIIVANLSWRYVFFVNVPIGVLLLVFGLMVIPSGRKNPSQPLDVAGIALLGSFLLTAMLGITSVGDTPPGRFPVWAVVAGGAAVLLLVAFLAHTRRAEAPFIPMRLLRGRGFGVMNLVNFLWGSIAIGFSVLIPLYAQDRFGLDPLRAGTLLTARAVGMIVIASAATFALRRTGYRPPMLVGFVLVAIGLALMAWVPGSADPYTWMAVAGAVTGLGMGFAIPAANNASMQLAPESIAAITGLRGMFRQAGSITSVSVATAVVARAGDAGHTFQIVFLTLAVVLVAATGLIFLVPEHRGSW
ncbi:MAG: MFS transporter [Promicromonosporaceae bacterium]|nr:MFS transporter [Promicromonosporaceae bacterium]